MVVWFGLLHRDQQEDRCEQHKYQPVEEFVWIGGRDCEVMEGEGWVGLARETFNLKTLYTPKIKGALVRASRRPIKQTSNHHQRG